MRAINPGRAFMDVLAEDAAPGEDAPAPVFSEANLYPRMYKGDARFILVVAEEYDALRAFLGDEALSRLLGAARRFRG